MPYKIRKTRCKKSSGEPGNYRLSYTDKSGKHHSSCHTSKKKAQGSIAAIEMRREGDDLGVPLEAEAEIRGLVREALLLEEITAADRREIEKISRRSARQEIERAIGPDLGRSIRDEVKRALGSRATREEIAEVAESVLRRLHRELAAG